MFLHAPSSRRRRRGGPPSRCGLSGCRSGRWRTRRRTEALTTTTQEETGWCRRRRRRRRQRQRRRRQTGAAAWSCCSSVAALLASLVPALWVTRSWRIERGKGRRNKTKQKTRPGLGPVEVLGHKKRKTRKKTRKKSEKKKKNSLTHTPRKKKEKNRSHFRARKKKALDYPFSFSQRTLYSSPQWPWSLHLINRCAKKQKRRRNPNREGRRRIEEKKPLLLASPRCRFAMQRTFFFSFFVISLVRPQSLLSLFSPCSSRVHVVHDSH